MAEPITLPDPDEEPPAGPNLELDPAYGEMQRAAQGKAESQFGNTVEPAVPPEWKEASELATALLGRSRDLRIMMMLAFARVNLNDFAGFAGVVATIREHLQTMWDHIHPRLDPEDEPPNDPTQRANALQQLTDANRILRPLRDLPLATPPRMRPVTWRDLAIAAGQIEAEAGREKMSDAAIRGAFAATDASRISALRTNIESVLADLKVIGTVFDTQAGYGTGPDFDRLEKLLREITNDLDRFVEMSGGDAPDADAGDAADAEAGDGAEGAAPARAARPGRSFSSIRSVAALESREDALHALSLAAAFFRVNEPSSPLPLLIDRAARLAPMAFMDLLKDLAPGGLSQAQVVVGTLSPDDA